MTHHLGQEYLLNAFEHVKPQVEFRDYSVGDIVIPAPDARLIALHAACARIAHGPGAVDHIEERYRDQYMEEIFMNQPGAAYELPRALETLQMFTQTSTHSERISGS